MARYLIEVPHEGTKEACERAVEYFLLTGSHFMTNADWGCDDGIHKAWFILDIDSKEAARSILPAEFRRTARIVSLRKFSMKDIRETIEMHAS